MWSTISIGTLGDAVVVFGSSSLSIFRLDAECEEGLIGGIFDSGESSMVIRTTVWIS